MILGKLKETAETYLGQKVTHAVVTVPACNVPSPPLICADNANQASMTPNATQPRILAPSRVFMFCVSSMIPPLLPSPMGRTRAATRT